MAKILEVFELPLRNEFSDFPLAIGEKVIVVEQQPGDPYIKVKHNRGQTISTYHQIYFTPLEGKNPTYLEVVEIPMGNKYQTNPLKMGEIVVLLEDIEGDQYIMVKHDGGQARSRLNREYFALIEIEEEQEA